MNILNVLYTVIISPLEMLIEAVFCFSMSKVKSLGAAGAIAAVSLAVSFLTLPIYNAADAIQQRERDTAARLAHWVNHIKQHFSGDERFMMLNAYYRLNNYHPLYALRSSLSIMIEVPFFIAAYHFLSHCPALQGASCGLLRDLGKPDGLIAISAGGGRSLTFNVLPILMTAINAASSAVYLKGFTIREKVQTYSLAGIFLILLYNSPSGLVLYWTLNNAFSLAKNAAQRWMKEPWRAAHGCVAGGEACNKCAVLQKIRTACALATVAALEVLIALRMGSHGTPGKYRLMLLAAAVVWAALPFTRQALHGDKKAYIAHALIAMVAVVTFLTLCVMRLANYGNPGKFRAICLAASFLFVVFPIERQAVEGTKYAMRLHLAMSGALCALAGVLCLLGIRDYGHPGALRMELLLLSLVWMLSVPMIARLGTPWHNFLQAASRKGGGRDARLEAALFAASCAGLALLLGWMLPASAIASDVDKFCFIVDVDNPLYYLWGSLCMAVGLFVVWPMVIYKMSSGKAHVGMPYAASLVFAAALLDVYVWKYSYGKLTNMFRLVDASVLYGHSWVSLQLPFVFLALAAGLLYVVYKTKRTRVLAFLCIATVIAECALSGIKTYNIQKGFLKCALSRDEGQAPLTGPLKTVFHLSQKGQNVVILYMDRASSTLFPYVIKEFPDLAQQFDGFVYYPNTLSFAPHTTKASPAVMGGYEYSPDAVNERPNELLVDKHNESLLVSPLLFLNAGFTVTMTDPPCSDYGVDPSKPFRPYPDISCSFIQQKYIKRYVYEHTPQADGSFPSANHDSTSPDSAPSLDNAASSDSHNDKLDAAVIAEQMIHFAIAFSILQAAPPLARKVLYDDGHYLRSSTASSDEIIANAVTSYSECLSVFAYMYYLSDLTDSKASGNTYTFIGTDLTHGESILQEPGYTPPVNGVVDVNKASAGYYEWKTDKSARVNFGNLMNYHVNAAAMLQAVKWFKRLKDIGVYDNTRIIIVADHGSGNMTPRFGYTREDAQKDNNNPLLMLKDFGSHGSLQTDNTFMTNADTILMAKDGLALSDINPLTGKSLSAQANKTEVRTYPVVYRNDFIEVFANYLKNKKQWIVGKEADGWAVHDNIFDKRNWRRLDTGE